MMNPILGILSGIAQVPQAVQAGQEHTQDRNALLQQQKNQQAYQKLLAENQQFDLDQKKKQVGQQEINTIIGQLNPKQYTDPKVTSMLQAKFKQYNLPEPQLIDGPDGQKMYDLNSYMAKPGPNISEMTSQERDGLLQYAPNSPERKAKLDFYTGSPEQKQQLLAEPQVRPALNTAEVDNTMKTVNGLVDRLSNGKLPYKNFVEQIKSMAPILNAPGSPVQYNELVDPKSPFAQGLIGQAAQSQIDHLKELGIHIANEDAYKKNYLAETTRRFGITEARKDREEANREAATQNSINRANTAASMAMRRLAVYEQNGQISLNKWQYQQQLEGDYGLNKTVKLVGDQYNMLRQTAQLLYASQGKRVPQNIEDQINPNLTDDSGKPIPTVASQYQDLVVRQEAALRGIKAATDGQLSATTGTKVRVLQTPQQSDPGPTTRSSNAPQYATSKSGKKIMSTDGGQTWEYVK